MPTFSFTFRSSLGERTVNTLPKNWKDIKFQLVRDRTYKGIGRKIAATFEFVKDGRKYLRDLYYNEGIDAYCEVDIWIHNDSKWRGRTLLQTYTADFSEIEITDTSASIKLVDSKFEDKINKRASTKININTLTSIDGDVITGDAYPTRTMSLHDRTVPLYNRHKVLTTGHSLTWIDVDPFECDIVYVSNPLIGSTTFHRGGIPYDLDTYEPEMVFLSNADKDIRLMLDINLNGVIVDDVGSFIEGYAIWLKIIAVDAESLDRPGDLLFEDHVKNIYAPGVDTISITISPMVNVQKGKSIIIGFETTLPGSISGGMITWDDQSHIDSYNVDLLDIAPTNCEVMLPHEMGERLLQLITGSQAPLYAPLFGRTDIGYPDDGIWSYLSVTNGYAIRQFDKNIHPINTSFKDWFKSFSSVINLAAYIENKDGHKRMVIDYFENIFDNSRVGLIITNYSDLTIKPIKDDYFGTIKIGYPNIDHENTTGLMPFNGEVNYTTPITNVSDTFDNVSDYVADDYAIALPQRKPYSNSPTEDTRYDDLNMFIHGHIVNGSLVAKRAENFIAVNGVRAYNSAFNLEISPARNLKRHATYLAVGLYRKADKVLKFVKGAKNPSMSTRMTGETETTYENVDIAISDLGTPIFLPNFIEFKSKLSIDDFKFINENPNHLIQMTIDGVLVYGFLDTIEYNITNGEAEIKLIQSNR